MQKFIVRETRLNPLKIPPLPITGLRGGSVDFNINVSLYKGRA